MGWAYQEKGDRSVTIPQPKVLADNHKIMTSIGAKVKLEIDETVVAHFH